VTLCEKKNFLASLVQPYNCNKTRQLKTCYKDGRMSLATTNGAAVLGPVLEKCFIDHFSCPNTAFSLFSVIGQGVKVQGHTLKRFVRPRARAVLVELKSSNCGVQ